jgi:hypothetical protein
MAGPAEAAAELPLSEALTPFERDFVLKQRAAECLSRLLHTVVHPAWTKCYLDLCTPPPPPRAVRRAAFPAALLSGWPVGTGGGDTALMAMHYGRCRALMAIATIFFQVEALRPGAGGAGGSP